jgi:hypothetical protein
MYIKIDQNHQHESEATSDVLLRPRKSVVREAHLRDEHGFIVTLFLRRRVYVVLEQIDTHFLHKISNRT